VHERMKSVPRIRSELICKLRRSTQDIIHAPFVNRVEFIHMLLPKCLQSSGRSGLCRDQGRFTDHVMADGYIDDGVGSECEMERRPRVYCCAAWVWQHFGLSWIFEARSFLWIMLRAGA
jgi:hypothetical protein